MFVLLFPYPHPLCYLNYGFLLREVYCMCTAWSTWLFGEDSNDNSAWKKKKWKKYSSFLQRSRTEQLHSTLQCWVGTQELPWMTHTKLSVKATLWGTSHCSVRLTATASFLLNGRPQIGHCKSNKILNFNADLTHKRFSPSHVWTDFQLSFLVEIKSKHFLVKCELTLFSSVPH